MLELKLKPDAPGYYVVKRKSNHPKPDMRLVEVFKEENTGNLYTNYDYICYVTSSEFDGWKWYGPLELEGLDWK